MRLISDRIVSGARCDCGFSIFFSTLWTGTLLLRQSVELLLRCPFSVGQLESTTLFLNSNSETILTASCHLHLDCGICVCVFTRSSPTLLMNFGCVKFSCFLTSFGCVHVGASFIAATVSSKIGSGAHAHRRSVRRFALRHAPGT